MTRLVTCRILPAALGLAALACTLVLRPVPVHAGVAAFAKTAGAYEMPIEAAGLASLPEARLDTTTAELFVAYRYATGTAQRTGAMTLRPARGRPAHYVGRWRTVEDDGTVYAGDLYLDFAADGTAVGAYTFGAAGYGTAIRRRGG